MDGTQQLVALGGLGLVAANFWTGQERPQITSVIWGSNGADVSAGHKALMGLGGELLLVFILVLAAGTSDGTAMGMLAAVAALWVLWGIHYYGNGGAGNKSTQAAGPATRTA